MRSTACLLADRAAAAGPALFFELALTVLATAPGAGELPADADRAHHLGSWSCRAACCAAAGSRAGVWLWPLLLVVLCACCAACTAAATCSSRVRSVGAGGGGGVDGSAACCAACWRASAFASHAAITSASQGRTFVMRSWRSWSLVSRAVY